MRKRNAFVAVACLTLLAWGCSSGADNPLGTNLAARMDDSGATAEGIGRVTDASNRFALDVYAVLRKEEGNVFLSPYSISSAMGMVYEGAHGQTADEIAAVFHVPGDSTQRRTAVAAVYNLLNESASGYELSVANALWAQDGHGFLEGYLDVLRTRYAAEATNVDFVGATEQARQTINTWVEGRTNQRIRNLFPQGTLNADTRLVLTNAIYFKGTWRTRFDASRTRVEDFHTSDGQTVNAPTMQLTGEDVRFRYTESENVQVLEMPYEGDRLSMLLLLPATGGLDALEAELTPDRLEEWKNALVEQRVDVYLPRFTLETKYFMNGLLSDMGMPTAFSTQADLSGMDGTRNLSIQHVIHQAFISVNEEGTEAAAATGVAVGLTSVPMVHVFRADRPFLFVIQDTETGLLLFMGRITNPNEGSATLN